jgi:hypothetical protein
VGVAGVRAGLGEHALPVRYLLIGERRRTFVEVIELELRLLHGRVEAQGRRVASRAASGLALDLHDAAPLPGVTVDEVAGHPVLPGQDAGGSHEVHERALELLNGSRFERLHERRIFERFDRDGGRVLDVQQLVAGHGGGRHERGAERRCHASEVHHPTHGVPSNDMSHR